MFDDWLKIRGIWGAGISLIISIFSFFIFFVPANNIINEGYEKNSFEMNSELNYCFPEPSKEQVIELKNMGVSDDIFPYFLTQSEAICGKKTVSVNVLLAENFDNLDFTMYSAKRLVFDSTIQGDNISYIDYSLAKLAGLNIGDEFKITINNEEINFIIAKIFEDNFAFPLNIPCILVKYTGIQKELYDEEMSPVTGYKGVFVGNTKVNMNDYIDTYIPKALLFSRDQFTSDEKYKKYTDTIKNDSYKNEIMVYNQKSALQCYKDCKLNAIIRSVIGDVFIIFCIILSSFILTNRKAESSYFKLVQNNEIVKKYRIYSITFDLAVSLLSTIVLCVLFSLTVASYLPGRYVNFSLLLMILAFIAGNFISYKMTQGIYKGRESEINENQKYRKELIKQLVLISKNFTKSDFKPEVIDVITKSIKSETFEEEEFEELLYNFNLSDKQVKELSSAIKKIRNPEKKLTKS